MKRVTTFLAVSLTGLLSVMEAAGEAPPSTEAKQTADEAFAIRAAKTRDALVFLEVEIPQRANPRSFGVFLSDDGLAFVDILALAGKIKPTCIVADEKFIEFGKILEVFPEQELALMKFEHRPKAFLSLALAEPDIGEALALVTLDGQDPWNDKVPPVVGPVMAKRSETTANLRESRFTKVLSLGVGLSFEQRNHLRPGCYAINRGGQLVAFTNGFRRARGQTIITLAPVVALAGKIKTLSQGGKDLGFPLTEEKNPYDPAALDPDYHLLNMAASQQNSMEYEELLKKLLKRYPKSQKLNSQKQSLELVGFDGLQGGEEGIDFPEPESDLGGTNAAQAQQWLMRYTSLAMRKQDDDAIKAIQKAIALCPKDYPYMRISMAALYGQRGRFKEAEAIYKEVYPLISDSIKFLETYEATLTSLQKIDEADEMSTRIYELGEFYKKP